MEDLTAFQRDLLIVIAGMDAPYGLAIKEEMEEYYESDINHGRLYPNLDSLVDAGLVSKGQIDRRTNCYELTQKGSAVLEDRKDWERAHMASAPLSSTA